MPARLRPPQPPDPLTSLPPVFCVLRGHCPGHACAARYAEATHIADHRLADAGICVPIRPMDFKLAGFSPHEVAGLSLEQLKDIPAEADRVRSNAGAWRGVAWRGVAWRGVVVVVVCV